MKKKFLDFLRRLPWASRDLLEKCFGYETLEEMLAKCSNKITAVKRADDRTYYSLKPANYHLLPGVSRREMARKFAAERYGYDVFASAESPCFNADLRVHLENTGKWLRIWGDMGHIAPESMQIFVDPPVFGNDLSDVILTCQVPERALFLKVQAEIAWKNAQRGSVEIIEADGNYEKSFYPDISTKRNMENYDVKSEKYPEVSGHRPLPHRDTCSSLVLIQELRSTKLSKLCTDLTQQDFDILRFTACNPFFEIQEIGLVLGGRSVRADDCDKTKEEFCHIMGIMDRVRLLEDKGLLKKIAGDSFADSYIPSWQGIDLLAAYHGTIPLYLKKYSQWPQESFSEKDFNDFRDYLDDGFSYYDSHCFYKQKWGEIRPEHQTLCKRFCTAMISGARSLKSEYGFNIEVSGLTTISSNLKITSVLRGKNVVRQLHPDACCTVTYSEADLSGKWKVFIEIERNTNSRVSILEKLEKYRDFIPAAKQFYKGFDDMVLMFFFDDTGADSGEVTSKVQILLEIMKKYGITGCAALLSDAVKVPEGWIPKHGDTELEASAGICIYQKIWMFSNCWPDRKKLPFPGFLF